MILVDSDIRRLCTGKLLIGMTGPMLDPFSEGVQGNGVISYGLSTAGYDLRLGHSVMIFKNSFGTVLDPKKFADPGYKNRVFDILENIPDHEPVLIPAHGYILGYSLEYIRIPRWLKGRCVGKSTYARTGVIINTTPVEPSWEGYLTIEIANSTPCQVAVYVGEGIAQLELEVLTHEPEMDYAQKQGKYMSQSAQPVPAKVKP